VASIRPYKLPGGAKRYEVRWREHGAAKSKSLTTSHDARVFKTETERRLRMGALHAAKPETFGDLEAAFMDRYRAGLEGKRKPRPKTVESMETSRAHLRPLRNIPVDKVGLREIEQVILPIAADRPETASKVLKLAKRILRSSSKRRQPIDLSALEASVAKAVPRTPMFLTWDQVQTVESFMPEFIRRIVPLAVLTLCRQGELLGLRDGDLDLDSGSLTVSEQAQRGKRTVTKTTASRRTIDLSPLMVDLFRQQQDARALGGGELVFPNRQGRVFDRHHFYRTYFKPAAVHAGLPTLTFHHLRHTGASLMIEAGIDVKTISERMGHVDGGALVLRTYGHLYKGRGRQAALQLEQLVTSGAAA
jgi:integrase